MPATSGYREPSGVYFSEYRAFNILDDYDYLINSTLTGILGLASAATGDVVNVSLSRSQLRLKYYKYDQWQAYLTGVIAASGNAASGIFDFCRNEEPITWRYYDQGESGHYTRSMIKSLGSPYLDFYVLPSNDQPLNSSVIPEYTDHIRFPWYQADNLVLQSQRHLKHMFENPVANSRHPIFVHRGNIQGSHNSITILHSFSEEATGIHIPCPDMVASGLLLKLNNLGLKPDVWITGDLTYNFFGSGQVLPGTGYLPLLHSVQQTRRELDYVTNVAGIFRVPYISNPTGITMLHGTTSPCCSGVSGEIHVGTADLLIYDISFDSLMPTGIYSWTVTITGVLEHHASARISDCFGNSSGNITFLVKPYFGTIELPYRVSGVLQPYTVSGTKIVGSYPFTSLDPHQDSFFEPSGQNQAPWGTTIHPTSPNFPARIENHSSQQFHWRIFPQTGICPSFHVSELTIPHLQIPDGAVTINVAGLDIPVKRYNNAISPPTGTQYTNPQYWSLDGFGNIQGSVLTGRNLYSNNVFTIGMPINAANKCWQVNSGTMDIYWTSKAFAKKGRAQTGTGVSGFTPVICTGVIYTEGAFTLNNICGPLIDLESIGPPSDDYVRLNVPSFDAWVDVTGVTRLDSRDFSSIGNLGIIEDDFNFWQNIFPVLRVSRNVFNGFSNTVLSGCGSSNTYHFTTNGCLSPIASGRVYPASGVLGYGIDFYDLANDMPGSLCGESNCGTGSIPIWRARAIDQPFCIDRIDLSLGVIRNEGGMGLSIGTTTCSGVVNTSLFPAFCYNSATGCGVSDLSDYGTGSIILTKPPGACESWWN